MTPEECNHIGVELYDKLSHVILSPSIRDLPAFEGLDTRPHLFDNQQAAVDAFRVENLSEVHPVMENVCREFPVDVRPVPAFMTNPA